MNIKTYKKQNQKEVFDIGDLVSIVPDTEYITRSLTKNYKHKDNLTIGVCIKDNTNTVDIISIGVTDVNVTGIVCVGDRLTTSNIAGKAKAIRNDNDEIRIFDIRPIGKVIGLYNDYSKAKVMLGIE